MVRGSGMVRLSWGQSAPMQSAVTRLAGSGWPRGMPGRVPDSAAWVPRAPLAFGRAVVRRVFCSPHQMEMILGETVEFDQRVGTPRARTG